MPISRATPISRLRRRLRLSAELRLRRRASRLILIESAPATTSGVPTARAAVRPVRRIIGRAAIARLYREREGGLAKPALFMRSRPDWRLIKASRSSAPCRMNMAACWSITSARRSRRMSASIRPRSTAAVDSRSSHSAIGNSVSFSKLRAKARVDCARGPSEPSMLIGRPSTKPIALRSAASASSRLASVVNFLRATVSTPVASLRSGSLAATPMVLVPRSSPISAPRAGKWAAASITVKIIIEPVSCGRCFSHFFDARSPLERVAELSLEGA